MISRTVELEAVDPKEGLTLDELAAFVDEARSGGVPGDTHIKVRSTVRSRIRKLEARA